MFASLQKTDDLLEDGGSQGQLSDTAFSAPSPVVGWSRHISSGPIQQSASTLAGPNQAEGAAGWSQPPVSTAILINQLGEAAQGLSQPSTSRAILLNQGGGAAHLTVAHSGSSTEVSDSNCDAIRHLCKAREIIGEMYNLTMDFCDIDNCLHGAHAKSSFITPALFAIILGWPPCLSSVLTPFQNILPATSISTLHDCAPPVMLAISLDVSIRHPSLIDAAITWRQRFKLPTQQPTIQWIREQCLQHHY